jgi:two-component system, NtrC family, sensor kinase
MVGAGIAIGARKSLGREKLDSEYNVKIGTRLTLALMLCVMPVLAIHTYWSVERSIRTYVDSLRRDARATTDGLAYGLEQDLETKQMDRVRSVFQRMDAEGKSSALFGKDGKLWFALPDFPSQLVPITEIKLRTTQSGEFEPTTRSQRWLCEFEPLQNENHQVIGYLLVAEDWTGVTKDQRQRAIGSAIASLVSLAIIAAVIPFLVRRYVSQPLAELSDKVTRLPAEDAPDHDPPASEVEQLTEEFRRLDQKLNKARSELWQRHRSELELERKLQHADRLATIGTLAAGLAHEIGTPMGVIRGRAENLLRKEPKSSPPARSLEIIISQIDQISRIVRTLLDYARTRESRQVTCDVRAIVGRTLGLVETEAARRNVQLETALGSTPLIVDCDADQLQQVFVNIAMNALDAMAASGGTLKVVAKTETDGRGPRLRLSFQDTGPGIAAQHLARVFDPFFTTKDPSKGTGMGLAVSQSIVHDHSGEITLESGPAGTSFFVTIPMAQPTIHRKTGISPA